MAAVFIILILLGFRSPLFAQENLNPPPGTDAAVLDETISGEAEEKITRPPEKPEIEVPEEEAPVTKEGEKPFYVEHIRLEGNTLIPTRELAPLVSPLEGLSITLSDAKRLARAIEREYRAQGHIMTYVYIPPQKVVDETLLIQVLEGRMGKLHIEGNRWFSKKGIERYWRLKEGRFLHYDDLSASIRRMNENPDRKVRSILRPGEQTGYTDVYLKVEDSRPIHAGFQLDNQGSEATGRRRFGWNVRHNNFIFPDAILLAGSLFGKDFGAVFSQYLIPVTSFGTKLALGVSHSRISPKKEFKGADIDGRSQTYSATLSQPWIEKDTRTVVSKIALDVKDSHSRNIAGTSRRDRLRILRPSLDLRTEDRLGQTVLTNEFSFGLNGLGAHRANSNVASRGADADFVKYHGTFLRTLRLSLHSELRFKTDYQLGLSKLAPQEQFYLGGSGTVRGYPEGDFLGDHGVLASLELHIAPFFIPPQWKLPFVKSSIKELFQLYGFTDHGYAMQRGLAKETERRSRYLHGLGAGTRIFLYKNISARVDFAHALGDEPLSESNHSRIHFSLQLEV